MLDRILSTINDCDLTRVYITLSIVASLQIVYMMMLTGYEHEDRSDPNWLQWIRRAGYTITTLGLLWGLFYMLDHKWQPWPPMLVLILGTMVWTGVRIVAIKLRISREGSRRVSHNQDHGHLV